MPALGARNAWAAKREGGGATREGGGEEKERECVGEPEYSRSQPVAMPMRMMLTMTKASNQPLLAPWRNTSHAT